MRLLNIVAFTFLSISLLLLSSDRAYSQTVEVPTLSQRVTDLTATLTEQEIEALAQKLEALEKTKGSQIAVLLVPSTGEESIEQFSIRVVDEWQLGRKDISDGVLFLVAKNDKRMRIEVGRGLEGALPDVIASRIIREYIRPAFKANDYVGGINLAVDKLTSVIQGEPLPPPVKQGGSSYSYNGDIFGLPIIFWLMILIAGLTISKIFGAWIGRGGAGIISLIAAFFAGTSIISAIMIGIAIVIILIILSTRSFGDLLIAMSQNNSGGFSSGSGDYGSSSSSNDNFSGGGGGFSGGGASGDW